MRDEVAAATAEGIAAQRAPHPVTVAWHGGEPLTTGVTRLERLLAPFEPLRQEGMVTHALQTNGTLINEPWCELIRRFDFRVGVSLDGPAALNANRRDRRGSETFDRALRGIDRLKAAGIDFIVIAVVSPETIDRVDELLGFFEELGPSSLGINIEERENANTGRPLISPKAAERFWHDVIVKLRGAPGSRYAKSATSPHSSPSDATVRSTRRGPSSSCRPSPGKEMLSCSRQSLPALRPRNTATSSSETCSVRP